MVNSLASRTDWAAAAPRPSAVLAAVSTAPGSASCCAGNSSSGFGAALGFWPALLFCRAGLFATSTELHVGLEEEEPGCCVDSSNFYRSLVGCFGRPCSWSVVALAVGTEKSVVGLVCQVGSGSVVGSLQFAVSNFEFVSGRAKTLEYTADTGFFIGCVQMEVILPR